MSKQYRVAVCGATGAVGNQMIQCLEERDFPLGELRLLASARSEGKKLSFKGEEIAVQVLGEGSFEGIDIALFSAGGSVSKEYAPQAAAAGAVVVDNSSWGTIRMHQELHHPGRVSATDLVNPDFVVLAGAYGMHAERVTATDGFAPAFERAMASPTGALLHLITSTDQLNPRLTVEAAREEKGAVRP